jgi:hypothetical protein
MVLIGLGIMRVSAWLMDLRLEKSFVDIHGKFCYISGTREGEANYDPL